jgi:hypothetical protein
MFKAGFAQKNRYPFFILHRWPTHVLKKRQRPIAGGLATCYREENKTKTSNSPILTMNRVSCECRLPACFTVQLESIGKG